LCTHRSPTVRQSLIDCPLSPTSGASRAENSAGSDESCELAIEDDFVLRSRSQLHKQLHDDVYEVASRLFPGVTFAVPEKTLAMDQEQ
jgi:hypothetical protein